MLKAVFVCFYFFLISQSFASSYERSNLQKAKLDIFTLSTAVTMFHKEIGRYPSNDEGLKVLTTVTFTDPDTGIQIKGLIKSLPLDPWENEYQYTYPSIHFPSSFDVWSYGSDGDPSDDDIYVDCDNWELKECDDVFERKVMEWDILLSLFLLGFIVSLPSYLYRCISLWRHSRQVKASLVGYHLGVAFYLILVFPFIYSLFMFS